MWRPSCGLFQVRETSVEGPAHPKFGWVLWDFGAPAWDTRMKPQRQGPCTEVACDSTHKR
eukprot:11439352-Alexandrium_andersonii.AAC.1